MKGSTAIFAFLTLFLLLISCKDKKVSFGEHISFNKETDLSYGPDSDQVMDLYIPHKKGDTTREAFIVIHGGGWRAGNKSQLTFFTLSLMKKFPEHIFVNMNYRLASETNYALPNQLYDIREVSQLLTKKLGYSPRLILLGNSAGGHLSMLYAYHSDPLKKVKAVINIVGPADLSDQSFRNYQEYSFVERRLVDPRVPEPGISRIDFASPIRWIDHTSPPTLSYYGTTDRVIPFTQGKILDSVLTQNNVMHESYSFNGGHLDWDQSPNDAFLIDKIDLFLKHIDKK
ncbi:alpha/beta hydrolase fold domain-containing protein [Chryseobacterium sp. 22458]|uniref:alpha/beta hydrolase fold domain-containing protein n=1 Tax=Chryseobacterium sp. 22458 TaxID=3453921 RepID=UPI003F849073